MAHGYVERASRASVDKCWWCFVDLTITRYQGGVRLANVLCKDIVGTRRLGRVVVSRGAVGGGVVIQISRGSRGVGRSEVGTAVVLIIVRCSQHWSWILRLNDLSLGHVGIEQGYGV